MISCVRTEAHADVGQRFKTSERRGPGNTNVEDRNLPFFNLNFAKELPYNVESTQSIDIQK